jgi:hypothetical protein
MAQEQPVAPLGAVQKQVPIFKRHSNMTGVAPRKRTVAGDRELKIEDLKTAIERLGWWCSIANDQISMTNSQSSETALFQRPPVKSELIYA